MIANTVLLRFVLIVYTQCSPTWWPIYLHFFGSSTEWVKTLKWIPIKYILVNAFISDMWHVLFRITFKYFALSHKKYLPNEMKSCVVSILNQFTSKKDQLVTTYLSNQKRGITYTVGWKFAAENYTAFPSHNGFVEILLFLS